VPGGVVVICGKKKQSVPQYNYSIEAIMEDTFEGGEENGCIYFHYVPGGVVVICGIHSQKYSASILKRKRENRKKSVFFFSQKYRAE
jgi:hypothetical protein